MNLRDYIKEKAASKRITQDMIALAMVDLGSQFAGF
jgi:hypothetical protein